MANIFHIERTANKVTIGTTGTLIEMTGRTTLTGVCMLAAGLSFQRVTGLQIDGVAMTGTLRGAYIDVSNGSTAATGTIRGMELKARTEAPGDTGNDVAVLEGLSISADSKGHSVTTMRAAEFILDGSLGGTIDEAVGLRIANNLQADKATTSYGLQIYRDSFDYTADIQLSSGGLIGGSTGALQVTSGGNVGVGTLAPSYKLSVGSPNGLYQAGLYHDNTNARIKWTGAGNLIFSTDEGTNTNTTVQIAGKGTGYAQLRIYDNSNNQYIYLVANDDLGAEIRLAGTSLQTLNFQSPADVSIKMFKDAASGETQELLIYGYRAGDALRSLEIGVGVDAADTASFDGVSNYYFDGNVGVGTTAPNAPLEVKGAKPGVVGGYQSGQFQVTGTGAEFYCAVITGHNAFNGNTQLWYLGNTSSSSHNDIAFINRQNAPIHFYTNNTSRVTIGAAGNVTFTGAINSGTLTFSTEGPTDNIDVTGVNTLFVDTSSNSVTIGGLVGGVDGQVLYIARISNVNNVILEHNEGGATQPILLHAGADETLGTEYGGWVLVCHGGTDWHDCSHAKHVV